MKQDGSHIRIETSGKACNYEGKPARIAAVTPGNEPGEAFLRLAVGPTTLLARVTQDSVEQLQLRPGLPVWALLKAVTFDHRLAALPRGAS